MSNPVPNNLALSVINTNDTAQSAPLRNNYAAIQTAVNQLIACLSGGTAGQRLQAVDGTDVQWVNQITYRKTSAKAVVNTVVETDLLNSEITVGAGVLGTSGVLRLTAWGDLVNNTGATQATPRFKLKLGATTIIDTSTVATVWATSVARWGWRIEAEIQNLGATNSQWANFLAACVAGGVTGGANSFATGEGGIIVTVNNTLGFYDARGGNSSAVDTTAAQTLALTVTNPVANAALDVTLKGALVEII